MTPATVNVAKGQTQALTAMAMYSDGTQSDVSSTVVWVSDAVSIATVSPSGVLTGVEVGETTVTASHAGFTSDAVDVTVTSAVMTEIVVTPSSMTLIQGQAQPLTATATYSDGTSSVVTDVVTWSSGANTIATVDGQGVVMGQSAGLAVVTARYVTHDGVEVSDTADIAVINTSVVTWGDPFSGGDSSAVQSELTDVTTIYSTRSAFAALKVK